MLFSSSCFASEMYPEVSMFSAMTYCVSRVHALWCLLLRAFKRAWSSPSSSVKRAEMVLVDLFFTPFGWHRDQH